MNTRSSRVSRSRRWANSRSSTMLHAARGERRAAILLLLRQFLAQPGHRPIEMMQIEPLNADDGVVLASAIARQLADHRAAAGLLPQPLDHQCSSDPTYGDLDRRIIASRA